MCSLRQLDPSVHATEEATLDALGHPLACSRIEAVLASFRVLEQCTRKLEIVLAVFLPIAMGLFMEEAIDDVLAKWPQWPRFLPPDDNFQPAKAGTCVGYFAHLKARKGLC
jgi:hypothetical protein